MQTYRECYCTLDGVKEQLAREGVAVVKGVVPEFKLESLRDGMWESLEHLTETMGSSRIVRDQPETFKNLSLLYPMHSMLIQHYGVGHAQYVWDVRGEHGVINAFAKLWDCEPSELITSFDGVSIHLPHEVTNKGFFRNRLWYHTDQRSTLPGLESIQGLVNLYDVHPGDATLRVLTKSNRFHSEYFTQHGIVCKDDWFKLQDQTAAVNWFKQKGCEEVSVLASAGDLVLWDSRTFHQGVESQKGRAEANFRAVVYTCMTKRSRASAKVQQKRRSAFAELRMTTHLPHVCKLFGKHPRTYGKPLPNVLALPRPVLNAAAKLLI